MYICQNSYSKHSWRHFGKMNLLVKRYVWLNQSWFKQFQTICSCFSIFPYKTLIQPGSSLFYLRIISNLSLFLLKTDFIHHLFICLILANNLQINRANKQVSSPHICLIVKCCSFLFLNCFPTKTIFIERLPFYLKQTFYNDCYTIHQWPLGCEQHGSSSNCPVSTVRSSWNHSLHNQLHVWNQSAVQGNYQ